MKPTHPRACTGRDDPEEPKAAGTRPGVAINAYALLAASGLLVAVKIWAGAPIPWWLALLPIWLLLALTAVTLAVVVAVGGFAALAVWLRRNP